MSEVARNIRRRFKRVNLSTPSANSSSPNIGVYSNQRVIPRTQRTDRGVTEFLSNMSAMIADNYREDVINQAEIDATTGEVTEEYQNNALYKNTVSTARAKRDGIELATRAEQNLQDAYEMAFSNGEDFDVSEYVSGVFSDIEGASDDPAYQDAITRIQGQVVESLIPKATAIDAQRQTLEADETAADIVNTTLQNAASEEDIPAAQEMLSRTLDELGMPNKDKRALLLSGYLNEIDRATDSDRVKVLETQIQKWLGSEDRGLLRRNRDEIRSVVNSAKRRIEAAELEAREKDAMQYDDNYLQLLQDISENPFSVSSAEITAAAESLGVSENEQRNRRMRLLELRQQQLNRVSEDRRVRNQQAEVFSRITDALATDADTILLDPEAEAVVDDKLERDARQLFQAPRQMTTDENETITLPSGIELLNEAAQDPTPVNMRRVAQFSKEVARHIKDANRLGRRPKMVKDVMPNVSVKHPRFKAAAMLYQNLESSGVADDIGLSDEAIARYTAYSNLVNYVSHGEAVDYMTAAEDSDLSQAELQTIINREIESSDERDILDQVLGDSDAANKAVVLNEVQNLAAMIMAHNDDAEKALELATERVANRTSVIDGIAVPKRLVPEGFATEYNKGDARFRASIQLKVEEDYGVSLPEDWKLRSAPDSGRNGGLAIMDPESGGLVLDPETGRALVINPTRTYGEYMKALTSSVADQSRQEAIDTIADAMAEPPPVRLRGTQLP